MEGKLFTMKQKIKVNIDYVQFFYNSSKQSNCLGWLAYTIPFVDDLQSCGLLSIRGSNVHVIDTVSVASMIAKEWKRVVYSLLNKWVNSWLMRPLEDLGSRLSDLIIVCDNAPCYSRLEIIDLTGATM